MKLQYEDYIFAFETSYEEDKKGIKKLFYGGTLIFSFMTFVLLLGPIMYFPLYTKHIIIVTVIYVICILTNTLLSFLFFREKYDIVIWRLPAQFMLLIGGVSCFYLFFYLYTRVIALLSISDIVKIGCLVSIAIGLMFLLIWKKYYSIINFHKFRVMKRIPMISIFMFPITFGVNTFMSNLMHKEIRALVALISWGAIGCTVIVILPMMLLFFKIDKQSIDIAREKKRQLLSEIEKTGEDK